MLKLLLIDDEEPIRIALGRSLRSDGYQVLTAENGKIGIELFREEKPSIVLTDIKMPGMDGIEVLKRVKEINPEAEVIVITGHGDIDIAVQSLKLNASDFITKPVTDEALSIALRRAKEKLDIRRMLKEYTDNLENKVKEATEELREKYEEVKRLQQELIQSERLAATGETVAGLAHCIKNIVVALEGGVDIVNVALEKNNMSNLSIGWDMVQRNISNVSSLVLDLLGYSKERKPEYEKCLPNIIADAVCELMDPKARKSGIEIARDFDRTIGEVSLDPKGIHRCLLNLVSNSVDACMSDGDEKKEHVVRVTTRREDDGLVTFKVSDNGCGMDEKVRKQIFTSFFSTKGSKGTGLGLLITHKIVQEHEGRISVDSEPGKGSIFTMWLPRERRGE
ncbi:MAG: response regulator [Pseudomonadota bacterium]